MNKVIKCRNCGIQVSIDTSLKMDQACPGCQNLIAVVRQNNPNTPSTHQGANTGAQVPSQPHTPSPRPTASHSPSPLTPAPLTPAPQDPYGQQQDPLSKRPDNYYATQPSAPKPDYLKPRRQLPQSGSGANKQVIILASVGGPIVIVLLIVVIYLAFRGSDDAARPIDQVANSDSRFRSTSSGPTEIRNASEFVPASYSPLPSLGTGKTRQTDMAYSWNRGKSTTYQFLYSMNAGGEHIQIHGTNRLTASHSSPTSILGNSGAEGGGTGSCFFVHPDGLAVTCAHVVEGADSVQVRVDKQWLDARVIDMDVKNDLALLKVERKNLPVLAIASSDTLELAQSIHIIGYPIQDVLGSSVKFNSGAVTGFKTENDASEFLFDANINPGNSGGPVIDQSGNAVGVAAAMLQGEGLNSVAMGVQSDRIFDLLRANNINLPVSKIDQPQEKNSELAKLTTPAVCLVKTSGRTGLQVLDHYTQFNVGNSNPATINGQLVVDSSGDVLKYDTESGGGVSVFLLSPSKIGIEKLNLYEGDRWQYRGAAVIAVPQVETEYVPVVPGYSIRGRFGVRPRAGQTQTKTSLSIVLGLETVNYIKQSEDDKFITFRVLKSVQSLEQSPSKDGYLMARLSGTMRYDKTEHRVDEMKLTGSLQYPLNRVLKNFSVKLEFSVAERGTGFGTNPSLTRSNGGTGSPGTTGRPSSSGRPGYTGHPSTSGSPGTPSSSGITSRPSTTSGSRGNTTLPSFLDPIRAKDRRSNLADRKTRALQELERTDSRVHYITGGMLASNSKLAFSRDSKFLFCAGLNLTVFDLEKKELVFESENLDQSISCIATLHRENKILLGDGKGNIRVVAYDENGKLTQIRRLIGGDLAVNSISVAKDDQTLLSAHMLGGYVWNINKTKPIHRLDVTQAKSTFIYPDKMEGIIYADSAVRKVDLETGKLTGSKKLKGRGSASFAADGSKVAVTDGRTIREWNLINGAGTHEFEADSVNHDVQYHPVSNELYAGSSGKVDLWKTSASPADQYKTEESTAALSLVISPDGKFLAVTSLSSACVFCVQPKP